MHEDHLLIVSKRTESKSYRDKLQDSHPLCSLPHRTDVASTEAADKILVRIDQKDTLCD